MRPEKTGNYARSQSWQVIQENGELAPCMRCEGALAGHNVGRAGIARADNARMKSHMSVVASRLLIFGIVTCTTTACSDLSVVSQYMHNVLRPASIAHDATGHVQGRLRLQHTSCWHGCWVIIVSGVRLCGVTLQGKASRNLCCADKSNCALTTSAAPAHGCAHSRSVQTLLRGVSGSRHPAIVPTAC